MRIDEEGFSRRAALAVLTAAAVGACAPARLGSSPLTLAEVVRRNTRARGGATALDQVRSLQLDVQIDEGGQELKGLYATNTAGLVRIDIYADGKFVGAEGIDSTGVWYWAGEKEGAKESVATGAANALKHGAEDHLFGWHRFPERGHQLALMPPQLVDGTQYQVVEIRYSTGHISYFYVDPADWQAVRRRDERAYHPDVDPAKQKVETRFSEFNSVERVVSPDLDQDFDLATGKLLASHRVLARRINPVLALDYFERDRRAPASWA